MSVEQLRKALRRHRMDRRLSYEKLAMEIEAGQLSAQTIRNFLEGNTEPHPFTVDAIEQYLKAQGVAA